MFATCKNMNVAKENVMKMNLLMKRVVTFVFALSLLLGMGLTTSSVTQAQVPSWQRDQWQRDQQRRQRQWERDQRRRQRPSQRDWRNNNGDGYPNYGGSYDLRQTALNAGYNEGIKEGRKDRERGDRFEFRDEEDFRNANTDYSSRFGNRSLYQQYFRLAFQNGYTDGYRGY
jgi:hypothetical protein